MSQHNMLPKAYAAVSRKASKARNAFYILGSLEGMRFFNNLLLEKLHQAGWPVELLPCPVPVAKYALTNSLEFVEHGICGLSPGYTFDKEVLRQASFWYDKLTPDQKAFASSEDGIKLFAKVLDETIVDVEKVYGKVSTVKYNQISLTRATFNMAAGIVQRDKPETALYLQLRKLINAMVDYRKQGGHTYDVQLEVNKALETKGWAVYAPHAPHQSDLARTLWYLASAVEYKTSFVFRLAVQDKTFPPMKDERQSKDFILAHSKDIGEALEMALKALPRGAPPLPPKP